jgi:hypothetical protein
MKTLRLILIFIVILILGWLFSTLLNSCAIPNTIQKQKPVVKQKVFYRVTPIDRDGKKGRSIIVIN